MSEQLGAPELMPTIEYSSALDQLVRVYHPSQPDGTGLVWIHGGSFTGGGLDMPEAHAVAHQLACRGTTVVSVNYRLAGPGNYYPAASDDVLAAWSWAASHLTTLQIEPSRLAIGGASAGGNLCAGAVLRLCQQSIGPLPAVVVLAYPTLMAPQPPPDSALRALLDQNPHADTFPPPVVRKMYEDYLGHSVNSAPLPAMPGNAAPADLKSFPAVLMLNDEVDELRMSAELFARTLREAGGTIDVITQPGTSHGHLNRPDQAAFADSLARISSRLSSLV